MAAITPSYTIVNPSYIAPEMILGYQQASGAFETIASGNPQVRLGAGDQYSYMRRLDIRTQVTSSQSGNANQLPSVALDARMISTPTYLFRCRGIYDHHDMAAAGNWNFALPEAQRLGMRQGIFQQLRSALLYGMNPAGGEGLLNTAGATTETLPADSAGNTTVLTYDHGQMAVYLLGHVQAAMTRTMQLGRQLRVVILGPQRVLGAMEIQQIVQLTSYQRPGGGNDGDTGASTLQLTMGGRMLGIFPLYKGNKADLSANDIIKDAPVLCVLDNTKTYFSVLNPLEIYLGSRYLQKNQNLSDVPDKAKGRSSLEVYSKTESDENYLAKSQNGADIPDKPKFIENVGLKETLNPTKRVSIGNIGNGAFDGSTPCINIGDSDSGFIGSADGVIDIYCNNAKVGYIDSSGIHLNDQGLHVGDARMGSDGNIWGTRWNASGQWLWDAIVEQLNTRGTIDWINNQLSIRDRNINARAAISQVIGIGQTYRVVTNKFLGVTYTNTSQKPWVVVLKINLPTSAEVQIKVNGVMAAGGNASNISGIAVWAYPSAIVPAGATYVVESAWGNVIQWVELQ